MEDNTVRIQSDPITPMGLIGLLMFIAGIAVCAYFLLAFSVTVQAPQTTVLGQTIGGGDVNNMGLMADRLNAILLCAGSAIIGAIFISGDVNVRRR